MTKRRLILLTALALALLVWGVIACDETPPVQPLRLAAAEVVTWQKIADEKTSFKVQGTQSVRYGTGNAWVTKNVTNSGWCGNWYFGSDPAPGKVKRCEVRVVAPTPNPDPTPDPIPTPTPEPIPPKPVPEVVTWTKVADEYRTFTVQGTKTVRFGSGSSWVTL